MLVREKELLEIENMKAEYEKRKNRRARHGVKGISPGGRIKR